MTDKPETIGDLYDRLPPTGEWVDLPGYGVRVRRWEDPATVQIIPSAGNFTTESTTAPEEER